MRASIIVSGFAFALACGSESPSNFNEAPARGGTSSSSSGGAIGAGGASGTTSVGGGSSGSSGSANGGGGASNTGGDTSSGGTGLGAAGDASAGAAGAPPSNECPGTAPGCVVDWAGQFGSKDPAQDGTGQEALFGADGISGITGDGTYVYVTDEACVRRVSIADATVETIAGQCGTPEYKNANGLEARFRDLDGIATDGTTLWVVDYGNDVIRAIDLSTMDVSTLTGQANNSGNNDGSNSQARFDGARGLTLLGDYLYLVEEDPNNDVRRIDPANGDVITVAGNGKGTLNGNGTIAQFNRPRKLGNDGTDLFVGDTENHRLRRILLGAYGADWSNTVSTLAGSTAGYTDATGTAARFRRPRGVAFDGTDLIVADSDNCVIRKVTTATGEVTTIAGSVLAPCANHTVGIGLEAEFNKPMDVYFDPGSGDLFIAEERALRRMYYQ